MFNKSKLFQFLKFLNVFLLKLCPVSELHPGRFSKTSQMTRDLNIHCTSEINVHMSISFTIYMPFDWSCDWSSLFLGSVYVVRYMD